MKSHKRPKAQKSQVGKTEIKSSTGKGNQKQPEEASIKLAAEFFAMAWSNSILWPIFN